jgi:hypothetical protein
MCSVYSLSRSLAIQRGLGLDIRVNFGFLGTQSQSLLKGKNREKIELMHLHTTTHGTRRWYVSRDFDEHTRPPTLVHSLFLFFPSVFGVCVTGAGMKSIFETRSSEPHQ